MAIREDKNANAQAWDKTSERTAASLTTLITSFGFDGIDFGVGLYPALAKDGDTCVMVPDVDDAD
jgi:chitinase